jgi:hypothetical protein
VKKLSEIGIQRSVSDKRAALRPFQQGQVNRLLDELSSGKTDSNFEWLIVQLDRKEFINKKGHREASAITVYLKRAPLEDINPISLFDDIERPKQVKLELLNRPPPRSEPPQQSGDRGPAPAAVFPVVRPDSILYCQDLPTTISYHTILGI